MGGGKYMITEQRQVNLKILNLILKKKIIISWSRHIEKNLRIRVLCSKIYAVRAPSLLPTIFYPSL